MDSKSAPPRRRQPFQLYVPVHRRTANTMTTTEVNSPSPSPPPPPERRHVQTSVPTGDTVVRRGRGQFRAPPTEQSEAEKPKRSTPIDKYTDVYAQRVYSTNDRYKTRRWSPPSAVAQTTATITEPFKRNDLQQQHNSNKKKDEMEELTASLSAFSVTNKDDTTSDSSSSSKEEWENLLDELSEDEDNKNNSNNKTESKRATSAPIDQYTEATTVLDCYDFPASFKTHHLHSIFQSYEGGYRIQWVHDTRALIIFESPGIAKLAFMETANNSLATIRPYTGPMDIIKPLSGACKPVRQRPMTTDMVARRLVHGALGVKGPPRTAAQREVERNMLQAVRNEREAKRQMAARRAHEIAAAFNE